MAADLYNRFKTDSTIWRAKERIFLAINSNPPFVMNTVGSYLYDYRKPIYAGKEEFFLENSYDAELWASVNEEKADLSKYIIPKIKEAWKTLKPKEKEDYKAVVTSLLDDYVDYLIAVKTQKTVGR